MAQKRIVQKPFRVNEGHWRRADLHLHTPASADWLEPGVSYLQWLQKAESRGLDIVAITDHNTVDGVAKLRAEIERLAWLEANDRLRPQERRDLDEYRRIGDKILVLPGFEFTATFGFHILAIFPPETSLRMLELLLLRLNVPEDRLQEGSTEVGPTTDVISAYRMINEAGGIVIAAHANSTHGVALQGLSFGGQTKIAFTQDRYLHALEVTDLESSLRRATARFFDGSKPEYPRRMHCIQGSDAHRLVRDLRDKNRLGIGDRVTEFLLPDVSYEDLKQLMESEDYTRSRPYRPLADTPYDYVEAAREKGANIVQDFHENMSREGGRLNRILCDVCAFANTRGGTLFVGVGTDPKIPIRGVENADIAAVGLRREIERTITPPIEIAVDVMKSGVASVIRAVVPEGTDKPYAVGQTRIYVREEAETNEAVRDEIVALVTASRKLAVGEPVVALPVAARPERPVQPSVPVEAPAPVMAPSAPVMLPVAAPNGPQPPAIGVEITAVEERKGARYFTIRDLRNGNTVQNVTLQSARKLWSYAINQQMTNPVNTSAVAWQGDMGLWQAARRAKKLRYDLVLRNPDGSLRVFYGVTADGMSGPWTQFLRAEDRADAEGTPVGPDLHDVVIQEIDDEPESSLESPTPFAPAGAEPAQPAAEKPARRQGTPRTPGEARTPRTPRTPRVPRTQPVAEITPAPERVVAPPAPPKAAAEPAAGAGPARSRRRKTASETTAEGYAQAPNNRSVDLDARVAQILAGAAAAAAANSPAEPAVVEAPRPARQPRAPRAPKVTIVTTEPAAQMPAAPMPAAQAPAAQAPRPARQPRKPKAAVEPVVAESVAAAPAPARRGRRPKATIEATEPE